MDLKNQEFIIFDVETTGLSPVGGDRIIEIAALKVKNFRITDEFYSFVDPKREIPFSATQVNGITQDMILGAPSSQEVLTRFHSFISHTALVGHNIKFDLSFVCYEFGLISKWFKDGVMIIDTLKIARNILPNLGRYPLWSVAKSLGIEGEQKHRARDDTKLTFQVFTRLVKIMGEKTLEDIGVLPSALDEFKTFRREERQNTFYGELFQI